MFLSQPGPANLDPKALDNLFVRLYVGRVIYYISSYGPVSDLYKLLDAPILPMGNNCFSWHYNNKELKIFKLPKHGFLTLPAGGSAYGYVIDPVDLTILAYINPGDAELYIPRDGYYLILEDTGDNLFCKVNYNSVSIVNLG